MAAQGRLGDQAYGTHEGGAAQGPAQQGAAATFVNGQPALRVGDTGDHTDASGDWRATQGSTSVFIEGKPAHRVGDQTMHDSQGQLGQGSQNTDVGSSNGGSVARPHDLELTIELRDATDRKIKGAHVKTDCPHPGTTAKDGLVAFDETTKITGLCSASPITIYKSLERGDWDPGAKSGAALPESANAAKDGSVRFIHAPAPESKIALDVKTEAERQVHIAKADQPKAVVRLTTAYNWMELVYKAFNETMPTGANQVALLGVREGVLNGGQRRTRDDDFATHNDAVIEKQQSKGATNHQTQYDDLIFLAVAPKDVTQVQRVEAYECSIDPGNVESTAAGIPLLLEGKAYHCRPWPKYQPNDSVSIYMGSASHMITTRIRYAADSVKPGGKGKPSAFTINPNHRTFLTIDDANIDTSKGQLKKTDAYKFLSDEASNPTILIHMSWDQVYVDMPNAKWSTGCTVLHHGKADPRYTDFAKTETSAANKAQIPYLVVSTRYVKSYAEWVKEVDKAPDQVPKASSVLRTEGLETPTGGAKGQYLPTTISKAFADEVTKKVAELRKPGAAQMVAGVDNATVASNLESSLAGALFTTAE
ncbi:MAG TPA: PAAR domain-containing protein [Polyangia bacterium]|jgi:uncharacterized Zn-binding protein involved in type VI secretion|nr:PAAR domain-containing protein [Polyangia bacterium]